MGVTKSALSSSGSGSDGKKKVKTRRTVSFGGEPDGIIPPNKEARTPNKLEELKSEGKSRNLVEGLQAQALTALKGSGPHPGGTSSQSATMQDRRRDIEAEMPLNVSQASRPETTSRVQNATMQDGRRDVEPEMPQDVSKASPGMDAISSALSDKPFSWGDGAAGWHPALMRKVQPRTRCWGPMTWADGID